MMIGDNDLVAIATEMTIEMAENRDMLKRKKPTYGAQLP